MHDIQSSLLTAIKEQRIKKLLPLRKLGELTGKDISAQQVKHHLQQLEKKGFFKIDKATGNIRMADNSNSLNSNSFTSLPIYGTANCGPALSFAEQRPDGFLKISSSLLKNKKVNDLFVVRASGNSMVNARINNKNIEDGDFLIVENINANPVRADGEIVLSVIDGGANVKRIYRYKDHIALVSDSPKNYPPIYVDSDSEFLVNGKIIEIMKNPIKN